MTKSVFAQIDEPASKILVEVVIVQVDKNLQGAGRHRRMGRVWINDLDIRPGGGDPALGRALKEQVADGVQRFLEQFALPDGTGFRDPSAAPAPEVPPPPAPAQTAPAPSRGAPRRGKGLVDPDVEARALARIGKRSAAPGGAPTRKPGSRRPAAPAGVLPDPRAAVTGGED